MRKNEVQYPHHNNGAQRGRVHGCLFRVRVLPAKKKKKNITGHRLAGGPHLQADKIRGHPSFFCFFYTYLCYSFFALIVVLPQRHGRSLPSRVILHRSLGHVRAQTLPPLATSGHLHNYTAVVQAFRSESAHGVCSKQPSYGVVGSRTAEFCAQHKKEDMVNAKEKTCAHPTSCNMHPNVRRRWAARRLSSVSNTTSRRAWWTSSASDVPTLVCIKHPSYVREGSKTAEFCVQHAIEGMVPVVKGKRCAHPSCNKQPLYAQERGKMREFCAQHKKEGMVDVARKRCAHPSCNKQPSFGVEGSKTAEFCAQHKKGGMTNVASKRCAHPSCIKCPSYGRGGSKAAEFCAQYKKEGMVDIVSKRCADPSCKKKPPYGRGGSKAAEFCAQHKKEGMVDIVSKRCAHPSCDKRPSYGMEGSNMREFCAQHNKKEGMVDVRKKTCGHPCLEKRPSSDMDGSKTPGFCVEHSEDGMVTSRGARAVVGVDGSANDTNGQGNASVDRVGEEDRKRKNHSSLTAQAEASFGGQARQANQPTFCGEGGDVSMSMSASLGAAGAVRCADFVNSIAVLGEFSSCNARGLRVTFRVLLLHPRRTRRDKIKIDPSSINFVTP